MRYRPTRSSPRFLQKSRRRAAGRRTRHRNARALHSRRRTPKTPERSLTSCACRSSVHVSTAPIDRQTHMRARRPTRAGTDRPRQGVEIVGEHRVVKPGPPWKTNTGNADGSPRSSTYSFVSATATNRPAIERLPSSVRLNVARFSIRDKPSYAAYLNASLSVERSTSR